MLLHRIPTNVHRERQRQRNEDDDDHGTNLYSTNIFMLQQHAHTTVERKETKVKEKNNQKLWCTDLDTELRTKDGKVTRLGLFTFDQQSFIDCRGIWFTCEGV